MTLYLLWWDNGLEYSDHDLILMGVFTSEERRQMGLNAWKADERNPEKNDWRKCGFWDFSEEIADQPFLSDDRRRATRP